jgi:hypothetical protein
MCNACRLLSLERALRSEDTRNIANGGRKRRRKRWRKETGISLPDSAALPSRRSIFLLSAFAPDERKGRYPLARRAEIAVS